MVSDWFHLLLGFHEEGSTPTAVRKQLTVENGKLRSQATGAEYSIGEFRTPSLGWLREAARRQIQDPKVVQAAGLRGPLRVEHCFSDAAELHSRAENRLALFQVASQTNCLSLVSPASTPEMGITGYMDDRSQGGCCAIACGAGAVFRNYFAPVPMWAGGAKQVGQSEGCQLNCLDGLCDELGNASHRYFEVKGGFTLARDAGLQDLNAKLAGLDEGGLEKLRSRLRVGVHEHVEVTSYHWGCRLLGDPEQLVTQVFAAVCSVAHSGSEPTLWEPLARLTLEANYEAALWAAVLSAIRNKGAHGSLRVYLTTVGRCLLGHSKAWIAEAVQRAIQRVCVGHGLGLQVFLVAYKEPAGQELSEVVEHFNSETLWIRQPSLASCRGHPSFLSSKNPSKDSTGVRNVSRETFQRWEQKVRKAFNREDEGNPPAVAKEALGVLAYERSFEAADADDVPSMVAAGMRAALPPKRQLNLWHAGKQAPDCVSYGCDGELFLYPVCEAGGCRTARQQMSTALPLEGERFAMAPGCDLVALSGDMCAWWRELAGRRLPGSLEADLVRWLQSLSQELDGNVVLRFCRRPTERRVVGTSEGVLTCTGSGPDSGLEAPDLECRVRWRDICRAAVNDKTMLAKVTGDERYRLQGLTRAVKDKATRKRSSQNQEGPPAFGDQNHLKLTSILESPLGEGASGGNCGGLRSGSSGLSGGDAEAAGTPPEAAEVPRSPSSKGTATSKDRSGLPEREQHRFLDICRNGDFERVKEFLAVNPFYINVNAGGRWSALHQFAYNGDSEAIQYLLDKLADPSATTTDGHTPAEVAQARVAKLLHTSGQVTKARPSTSLQVVGLMCTPCFVKKALVRPPNA